MAMSEGSVSAPTRVLLCACAGIACYKAVEVLRGLVKAGCEVRVAATEDSLRFVGAATWEGLCHERVATDVFSSATSTIPHVELAGWADVVVVVPATADVIARMRIGLAHDLVSAALLAVPAEVPILVAPAMNTHMWASPAVRENIAVLRGRGVRIVEPERGELACVAVGDGRLAEPETIVRAVLAAREEATSARTGELSGVAVLVSAGPTHEAIDPVRYIANASSGKMGFAVAEQAALAGAQVTLVAGPVSLPTPAGVRRVDVVSAHEMHEAMCDAFPDADICICAAAVADYTPRDPADHKLKKAHEHLDVIHLKETADILKELCARKGEGGRRRIVCGFAAETNDLIEHATAKLTRKGADLIVANDVSRTDSGFGSDTNRVTLITPDGIETLETLPKDVVADRLLTRLASMLREVRACGA